MPTTTRIFGTSLALMLTFLVASAPAASAADPKVEYKEILRGYSLPLLVTGAPGSPGDIFVVEQGGLIKRATTRDGKKWIKAGTYLDLTSKVIDPSGQGDDEQGLLGLTFHPNYSSNGLLYVYYTRRTGTTVEAVVAEYRRQAAGVADPSSGRVVLKIEMPARSTTHTGGQLAFGPDGYLYVGVGDGGGLGDPDGFGQNTSTLLAKILRIDPRDPDGGGPSDYSVPSDNPFVGVDGKDEIWVYGTRQPWRFSFDHVTNDLWIADVGEDAREEVNRDRANASGVNAGKGDNLGWSRCEGSITFKPVAGNECTVGKLPLYEYGHAAGWCSVTGGFVYRGPIKPEWQGLYIAADWCGGQFVLDQTGGVRLRKVGTLHITSFGEDAAKRLFAVADGKVFLVKPNGPPALIG